MESGPLVTIAIPTRDRCGHLRRAVSSALAQTYTRLEVIVSDNASTDETAAYLAALHDPRIRVLLQPVNLGLNGNWRACLDAARGEYFLLLSDDDLLDPTAIEELMASLVRGDEKEAVLAYARCNVISADDRLLWETQVGPISECGLHFIQGFANGERGFYPCALLARTDLVRESRAFEEDNGPFLDFALLLWLSMEGDVAHVPRALISYRLHRSNTTARCVILESKSLMERILGNAQHRLAAKGRISDAEAIGALRSKFVANVIVTVASHAVAARRQLPQVAKELWETRDDLLTSYVALRALKQIQKTLRLFIR